MRNVTLSARPEDIDAARERALSEHTTLNEEFRKWLAGYGRRVDPVADFDALMEEVAGQVVVGRRFTRDERNAR